MSKQRIIPIEVAQMLGLHDVVRGLQLAHKGQSKLSCRPTLRIEGRQPVRTLRFCVQIPKRKGITRDRAYDLLTEAGFILQKQDVLTRELAMECPLSRPSIEEMARSFFLRDQMLLIDVDRRRTFAGTLMRHFNVDDDSLPPGYRVTLWHIDLALEHHGLESLLAEPNASVRTVLRYVGGYDQHAVAQWRDERDPILRQGLLLLSAPGRAAFGMPEQVLPVPSLPGENREIELVLWTTLNGEDLASWPLLRVQNFFHLPTHTNP